MGYDGQSLVPFGSGFNGYTSDAVVFKDTLYVSGKFDTLGGKPINSVGKWTGSDWEQVGGFADDSLGFVSNLHIYQDSLFASGVLEFGENLVKLRKNKWFGIESIYFSEQFPIVINWKNYLVVSDISIAGINKQPFYYSFLEKFKPLGNEFAYHKINNLFTKGDDIFLYSNVKGLFKFDDNTNIWDSILPPLGDLDLIERAKILSVKEISGNTYVVGDFLKEHGAPSNFIAKFDPNAVRVPEIEKTSTLHLTPNPTKGNLSISSEQSIQQVIVFNLNGQRVLEEEINSANPTLNLSNLPNGTYVVKVLLENQALVIKRVMKL